MNKLIDKNGEPMEPSRKGPNWPPRLELPADGYVSRIDEPYTSGGGNCETLRPIRYSDEKQPQTK